MKFPQTITILALTAILAVITIPAFAQQASNAPMPQDQQQPQAAQAQPQQDSAQAKPPQQAEPQTPESQTGSPAMVQTFQGKVSRSQGQYVLTDPASGTSYKLDDQKKAKEFVGKSVKVTGALDESGKMIHVSSIGPAS